jgi:anaerobic magnesium-protoporphyrin IX monomethyl ester cyclase
MELKLSQTSQFEKQPRVALVALHAGYHHSSLALQSIAAYADSWGCPHQMQIFETLVNTNQQKLIEELVAYQPQILGFSTYLWNIAACLRLTRLLKQLLPDMLVVFGGPEAGARGSELLTSVTELDFVIAGEGESAFSDLMNRLLNKSGSYEQISGLFFRKGGDIQQNPMAVMPVDRIPAPIAQGLFETQKRLVYWETSRGCPYKCTFCTSANDRLRAFPLDRLEADLQVLEKLTDKTIKLLDRSFHLGQRRTTELLQRFASTPAGLRFHLELNPDRISKQAMALFSRARRGKFQFEIGLQTLDEGVLRAIERRMDVAKALDNIRKLVEMRRHPVHLDLIVGLPGESKNQCAYALDQTYQLYPDHLQLGILKLLPGTPLHRQAQQLGYRWDPEPPYEVLSNPSLSFNEIAQFKRYAALLERLYNSGLMKCSLSGLVAYCFAGSVSRCFNQLLVVCGRGLASDNHQPDSLFESLTTFIEPYLETCPNLAEWIVWDYCQFSLVNSKTPPWIAQRLNVSERFIVQGHRRRMPIIFVSKIAIQLINKLTGTHYIAGRYAIWPKQHKKGKPVQVISID